MELIQELMSNWDVEEIEKILDKVEEDYKNLVNYTSLFEGVLDNLPEDIIEKVAEIEKRIDAVARARQLLTKLKKSGGYSPEQVKTMRGRVGRNAAKLRTLLDQTKKELDRVSKKVEAEVEKVEAEEKETNDGFDLRDLDRSTVNVLRKVSSGRFDPDRMDDLESMEALSTLQRLGLIDNNDKITAKGKQSLSDLRKNMSVKRNAADIARQDREDREELADV